MTTGTLAFGAIVLFMIHEFDEIIFVRAWLKQRSKSLAMWNRNVVAYPSTSVVALMIAEEFVLLGAIMVVAVTFDFPELILGLIIANSLHLLGHLADAARVRAWPPGSLTAVVTLALNVGLVWVFAAQNPISISWSLTIAAISAIILLLNLKMLHKLAPRLQKFLDRVYQK